MYDYPIGRILSLCFLPDEGKMTTIKPKGQNITWHKIKNANMFLHILKIQFHVSNFKDITLLYI